MQCYACGSRDIEFHEAAGHAACVSCGVVQEESAIVSSIEFQEQGDRSHVVGQYISANCSKPFAGVTRGRYCGSRESRESTLANAKRVITQVTTVLRLPHYFVERSYRLYQIALQHNFLFGRRQAHIVATCLYIVCRQEKSPYLLIDFADALQCNVYLLGKSYVQFTSLLGINLGVVDPALYIHRFAVRLDLGSQINNVVNTALRLISRFKKDWLTIGRRPDGICAAAMLIASRAHGFDKCQTELAKLFRVAPETVKRRLFDFKATPSAQLTLDQFKVLVDKSSTQEEIVVPTHDATISQRGGGEGVVVALDEYDPPSYNRNRATEIVNRLRAHPERPDIQLTDLEYLFKMNLPTISVPDNDSDVEYSDDGDSDIEDSVKDNIADKNAALHSTSIEEYAASSDLLPFMPGSLDKSSEVFSTFSSTVGGITVKVPIPRIDKLFYSSVGRSAAKTLKHRHAVQKSLYKSVALALNEEISLVNSQINNDGMSGSETLGILSNVTEPARKSGVTFVCVRDVEASETALDIHSSDFDEDSYLNQYILTEEERVLRSAVWERSYRGYLNERENRQKSAELNVVGSNVSTNEGEVIVVPASQSTKRKRNASVSANTLQSYRTGKVDDLILNAVLGATEVAVNEQVVSSASSNRLKSRKIDYSALQAALQVEENVAPVAPVAPISVSGLNTTVNTLITNENPKKRTKQPVKASSTQAVSTLSVPIATVEPIITAPAATGTVSGSKAKKIVIGTTVGAGASANSVRTHAATSNTSYGEYDGDEFVYENEYGGGGDDGNDD